jgi:hypothetical protein
MQAKGKYFIKVFFQHIPEALFTSHGRRGRYSS